MSHLLCQKLNLKFCQFRGGVDLANSCLRNKMFFNASLQRENLSKLQPKDERKRILYIADYFCLTGGTETRLLSQSAFLESKGWECFFLTEFNQFNPSYRFINFHLGFNENSFNEYLFELIRKGGFDCVEFIFKGWDYIQFVNLLDMKKMAKVGCFISNQTNLPSYLAQLFSYRVLFMDTERYIKNCVVIQNWLKFPPRLIWKFGRQTKAIFISRIDREKLPTLKNFLRICKFLQIEPVVAGYNHWPDDPQIKPVLEELPSNNILPTINVVDFLEEKGKEFLFVGGVGQVVLESIAFGIPSLVLAHTDNALESVFVTKENYVQLAQRNFTIKPYHSEKPKGNLQIFSNDYENNKISEMFFLSTRELSMFSLDKAMGKYLSLLQT